jgi:threonine dehydrogenase-like Zn-dependent dehydrogenase
VDNIGDTEFLPDEVVDRFNFRDFREENQRVRDAGGRPAQGKPVPLGITKAPLSTAFCRHYGLRSSSTVGNPADRVGVTGIAGLGHLAVQFARAMGADVFAFSTSPDRLETARAVG